MTSSDQNAPSYEELAALVVEQATTITRLRADLTQTREELHAARERITELEARVGSDSTNSSKPSAMPPSRVCGAGPIRPVRRWWT